MQLPFASSHTFFPISHSPVDGRLSWFRFLAIVNGRITFHDLKFYFSSNLIASGLLT